MAYAEFNALTRGLRSIPERRNPDPKIGAGTDASAIHGRPSAQVALLQSPILSAARSTYIKRRNFRGLPVDKPHTRNPRLKVFNFSFRHFSASAFTSGSHASVAGAQAERVHRRSRRKRRANREPHVRGLFHFNPGKRAKSASVVCNINPRSIASAARCASVVKLPAVPIPFNNEDHVEKWVCGGSTT